MYLTKISMRLLLLLLLFIFLYFSRAWMKITLCNSSLPCLNKVLLLLYLQNGHVVHVDIDWWSLRIQYIRVIVLRVGVTEQGHCLDASSGIDKFKPETNRKWHHIGNIVCYCISIIRISRKTEIKRSYKGMIKKKNTNKVTPTTWPETNDPHE